MEKELLQFIDIIQKGGLLVVFIILAVPKFRKMIFGNGNGYDKDKSMKRFDELDEKINLATNENHHSILEKLDKILDLLIRLDERIK